MIAVTGASGFLGRHVLRSLEKKKISFVALVRSSGLAEGTEKNQVRRLDFKNPTEIDGALRGVEQVLHLAGRVNGPREDLEEANLHLTERLVEAARRAGVKRFLFVSSAAAYLKKGPYGQTKWKAEEFLKSSGIPFLIFRPTLIYGPGDTKNVAMIDRLVKRFPVLPLLGGGKFLIQPVYVDDIVTVLVRALESSFENRTYSLAGPSQIPLKEMIEIIAASSGRNVRFIPVPLKPVQWLVRLWVSIFPGTRFPVKQILELDRHSAFEIEEARRDLGFSPRPFREGVSGMRNSETLCVG